MVKVNIMANILYRELNLYVLYFKQVKRVKILIERVPFHSFAISRNFNKDI